MTNKITLEINTDSNWDEDEKDGLLQEFVEFMQKADDGVDASSADVTVTDSAAANSSKPSVEEIREAAAGLIANGIVETRVRILDIDGNVITKTEFSTED